MLVKNSEDLSGFISAYGIDAGKIKVVVYSQEGVAVADATQDYDHLCRTVSDGNGYRTHKGGYLWYIESSNYNADELNQIEGVEGCSQQYRDCESGDYPQLTQAQIKQALK